MQAFYNQAVKEDSTYPCNRVTSVYMLESGGKSGDPGHLVPALSIDLGNGQFIAFAPDQVILKSNHAGMDTYHVYFIPGIKLSPSAK